jgi:hypothetical protein
MPGSIPPAGETLVDVTDVQLGINESLAMQAAKRGDASGWDVVSRSRFPSFLAARTQSSNTRH